LQLPAVSPWGRDQGTRSGVDPSHAVGFYERDDALVDAVVDFLVPGLSSDQAAVVVATGDHRRAIELRLRARAIDVDAAVGDDLLVFVDAQEALDGFMRDGLPDVAGFWADMEAHIARATRGRRELRLFGEMVALLWEQGNVTGALALEDLWNSLARSHRFMLLCGYPLSALEEDGHDRFEAICSRHTAVVPVEGTPPPRRHSDAGERSDASLQQELAATTRENRELRARLRELEHGLERLHDLDRLRSEFVATVVHDVQSPAVTASAFLELLQESWHELDEEQLADFLGRTLESTRRIERLAGDIMTMARVDAGAFTFDLRPVDLGELVEEAASHLRQTTNRVVEVDRPVGLPLALADPDRQLQILGNLLSNAAKYSPPSTPVRVGVTDRGDHLRVAVTDLGTGISDAERERLFQPFVRLRERDPRQTGTGLGLYAAKALVEGQGGTITVQSAPGKGATFAYTVPRSGAPEG
jgi:signal transduction histidine kinase